jgi:hypothetical protein
MGSMNSLKYFSLMLLLGAGACTSNQYASRSGSDDLYGGGSSSGTVSKDRRSSRSQELSRSSNPDYVDDQDGQAAGTDDYYDDSYISARNAQRNVSSDVGYNAGFADGFNQATRFSNPYGNSLAYNGYGSYYPGYMSGMGGLGFGSMFGMSPYSSLGLSLGYSSFGFGGGYSPFGYSPYSMGGYSPFGYDSFYGNMYGYGGYGGYGGYYSPWAYSSPVIVVNSNTDRRGYSRTYGARSNGGGPRSSERYNSSFVNSPRSSNTSSRNLRSSGNAGSDTYYAAPRSNSRGNSAGRDGSAVTSGNARTGSSYSRSGNSAGDGNTYYARPRTSSGSDYSSDNSNTYTPRTSRSGGNTESYNLQRSQSNYSAPARTAQPYQAPTRSYDNNYSAPARSNSNNYSAPARSYSAPSYSAPSGGGGGGAGRGGSRGPR